MSEIYRGYAIVPSLEISPRRKPGSGYYVRPGKGWEVNLGGGFKWFESADRARAYIDHYWRFRLNHKTS